ncbi:MAG TPA: DUF459 domain-containing protein [Thiotrichaceae bacterium]|nr:DUF459 domain-containing protein [Thiotrichaceae bacterium]
MRVNNVLSLLFSLAILITIVLLLFFLFPILTLDERIVEGAEGVFETAERYEQKGNALQAVNEYRKAAEQGLAKAQFKLAMLYHDGQSVSQNMTLSVNWLDKAAKQGMVEAQLQLADMYYQGTDINQNLNKALGLYIQAAMMGATVAQFKLGQMYSTGQGVNQDWARSAQWYHKAAEQGEVEAQFELGMMYQAGKGVSEDLPEAVRWFKKAAEREHVEAKQWLARLQAQVPVMEAGQFKASSEVAAAFDNPELQTLTAQAHHKMKVALAELQLLYAKGDYEGVITQGSAQIQLLYAKGDYEGVITQGSAQINYGDDIKKWVDQAKKVQAALAEVSELMAATKLQEAYDVAVAFEVPELQMVAADAKSQLDIALAELQYLYVKGDYAAVVNQGSPKMLFSEVIQKLVKEAETAYVEVKREQIKTTLQAALDDKAANLTIAIIGDSQAYGIWAAIYRELRQNKDFTVIRETRTASGLAALDWRDKVKGLLDKQRVHIALIVMGANDGQVLIRKGKPRLAYKSPSWKTAYVQRVKNLMGLLEDRNILTFWIGLPAVRRESMKEQVTMLNGFYEKTAASFAAVRFLPIWHLTVNEGGKYSAYGLDVTGRKRLLRANDGVHFTTKGYDVLTRYILESLYQDFPFIKSEGQNG